MTQTILRSIVLLILSPVLCLAEEPNLSNKEELIAYLKKVDEIAAADGVDKVPAFIEITSDSKLILRKYVVVTSHLYRGKNDIAGMLSVGQAGIAYTLRKAKEIRDTDSSRADELQGIAKTMAYNLSVNAWPGWDEKEMTISPESSAIALKLAKQNLMLGLELKRPDDALGNAYWLLGAQHIAHKQHVEAEIALKQSSEHFAKAKKPDYQLMAKGYLGLALMTNRDTRKKGEEQFDLAIAMLKERDTPDGRFFVRQLQTAKDVFTQ